MQVINLTGHEVHELKTDIIYPATEHKFRVWGTTTTTGDLNGAPIDQVNIDKSSGLPPRIEGTIYIVSQLSLHAVPDDRDDIVAPKRVVKYTSGPLKGTVKGCIGFRRK